MTSDDFLVVHGVTVEWIEDLARDLLGDKGAKDRAGDARVMLSLVAKMVEAGVAVPPIAASLAAAVLRDVGGGVDAREQLGTKPGRGAPESPETAMRHSQASACLALLLLCEVPKSEAVALVAKAAPMSERNVYDLPETGVGTVERVASGMDWDAKAWLIHAANGDLGDGVLNRLLQYGPKDDPELNRYWHQFREFLSVTDTK